MLQKRFDQAELEPLANGA